MGPIVVSDTVGFVRDLPHALVAAFHATLEETVLADVLLHVVDASSAAREQQIHSVNAVLNELGADEESQIIVWNKIDLTTIDSGVERDDCGKISRVKLSARNMEGLHFLRDSLAEIAARGTAISDPRSSENLVLD